MNTFIHSAMIEKLAEIESVIIAKFGWPSWALRLFSALSALVVITAIFDQMISFQWTKPRISGGTSLESKKSQDIPFSFRIFQFQYLSVYLITMLADWLQGTNMYTLYTSYGVNVGTLFITGFLSSAVFGTFLGMYVDRWGRKMGCVVFCLLEVVINLLEHIPSMPLLLVGRVLGGLSTSLLFTAFESWMVSEHRKKGFAEDLLASTFSIASAGNGLMAITAGVCAQMAADVSGDIGPFQLAIVLTIVTLVFIFFWQENYGHDESDFRDTNTDKKSHNTDSSVPSNDSTQSNASLTSQSFWQSMQQNFHLISQHPKICLLGCSQACFEGAVYTFVFMWVPSLLRVTGGNLPTGLVFSAFMLSMTFGGLLFGLLLPWFPGGIEGIGILIACVSAMAMAIPVFAFDFEHVLGAFLLLEAMVGMFNSCGPLLRSKYYPEGIQSSIMSAFRLPLNILVVLGTKLADYASDEAGYKFVFSIVVVVHLIAGGLLVGLMYCRPSGDRVKQE